MVMEPRKIDYIIEQKPSEIYFLKEGTVYTDNSTLTAVYECVKSMFAFKAKDADYDTVTKRHVFAIQLGDKAYTFYVSHDATYLYIDYSHLEKKSAFHWMCRRLYGIYDSSPGIYYYMHFDNGLYELLEGITVDPAVR